MVDALIYYLVAEVGIRPCLFLEIFRYFIDKLQHEMYHMTCDW